MKTNEDAQAQSPGNSDAAAAGSKSRKGRVKQAAKQRPANAEELSPETLLPDLVNTDLQRTQLDEESRHARIAKRAHEIAERRGFASGSELDDWLQAEREIDSKAGPQLPPENQFTG
jgi:Protein of unknown function (DUF2934)